MGLGWDAACGGMGLMRHEDMITGYNMGVGVGWLALASASGDMAISATILAIASRLAICNAMITSSRAAVSE